MNKCMYVTALCERRKIFFFFVSWDGVSLCNETAKLLNGVVAVRVKGT